MEKSKPCESHFGRPWSEVQAMNGGPVGAGPKCRRRRMKADALQPIHHRLRRLQSFGNEMTDVLRLRRRPVKRPSRKPPPPPPNWLLVDADWPPSPPDAPCAHPICTSTTHTIQFNPSFRHNQHTKIIKTIGIKK